MDETSILAQFGGEMAQMIRVNVADALDAFEHALTAKERTEFVEATAQIGLLWVRRTVLKEDVAALLAVNNAILLRVKDIFAQVLQALEKKEIAHDLWVVAKAILSFAAKGLGVLVPGA